MLLHQSAQLEYLTVLRNFEAPTRLDELESVFNTSLITSKQQSLMGSATCLFFLCHFWAEGNSTSHYASIVERLGSCIRPWVASTNKMHRFLRSDGQGQRVLHGEVLGCDFAMYSELR